MLRKEEITPDEEQNPQQKEEKALDAQANGDTPLPKSSVNDLDTEDTPTSGKKKGDLTVALKQAREQIKELKGKIGALENQITEKNKKELTVEEQLQELKKELQKKEYIAIAKSFTQDERLIDYLIYNITTPNEIEEKYKEFMANYIPKKKYEDAIHKLEEKLKTAGIQNPLNPTSYTPQSTDFLDQIKNLKWD